MIVPKIILCCDTIFQDISSRKVSLINLFDQINSALYPVIHSSFSIWVKIERDELDSRNCLLVISLSIGEDLILNHTVNVDFVGSLRHEAIIKVGSLLIPRSGELTVKAAVGEVGISTIVYLNLND